MRRFVTHTLVWLVVASLLAATPMAAFSALTSVAEVDLSDNPDLLSGAAADDHSYVETIVARRDRLFYFHDKTEEEAQFAESDQSSLPFR